MNWGQWMSLFHLKRRLGSLSPSDNFSGGNILFSGNRFLSKLTSGISQTLHLSHWRFWSNSMGIAEEHGTHRHAALAMRSLLPHAVMYPCWFRKTQDYKREQMCGYKRTRGCWPFSSPRYTARGLHCKEMMSQGRDGSRPRRWEERDEPKGVSESTSHR